MSSNTEEDENKPDKKKTEKKLSQIEKSDNKDKLSNKKSDEEIRFEPYNGYLILIDIVNSTTRKLVYTKRGENHWTEHLKWFYQEFYKFSNELIDKIEKTGDKNQKKKFEKKQVVRKTIGDMGLLFLPFEYNRSHDENKKITRDKVAEGKNPPRQK